MGEGACVAPPFSRYFVPKWYEVPSARCFPVGRGSKQDRAGWVRFSGIGIEFVGAMLGFGLIGFWIDSRFETAPWGLVIGAFLGLIGATYNAIRQTRSAFSNPAPPTKKNEPDDRD